MWCPFAVRTFIEIDQFRTYTLDEGQYLCSERTMYRILAAEQPVRERRNQLAHPPCTKPELVATAPNQTWSWDITRLLGPKRWTMLFLTFRRGIPTGMGRTIP